MENQTITQKLEALVKLQSIDTKLDQLRKLRGDLPDEVQDLEDEIEGLHARQTRVEEEINGITDFMEQKKAAIKEAQVALKPTNISANDAVSLAIPIATAYTLLIENAQLQAGQKILIHGAGGGVGSIMVQIAKAS